MFHIFGIIYWTVRAIQKTPETLQKSRVSDTTPRIRAFQLRSQTPAGKSRPECRALLNVDALPIPSIAKQRLIPVGRACEKMLTEGANKYHYPLVN